MKNTNSRIPMSVRRLLFWGLLGLICSALISLFIADTYNNTLIACAVFLALSIVLFVALFHLQNAVYQRPLTALASKVGSLALSLSTKSSDTALHEISGTEAHPALEPPSASGQPQDIPDEFAKIEQNLDLVAENLNAQSREVTELAGRLQSIFDATEEAIVAIRAPNELLAANTAAYRLFELPRAPAQTAESFFFKAPPIIGLIDECLREGHALLEQFSMLKEKNEVILTARGRRFRVGNSDGVVIVINDVTSLKRMELLKKNFVANVSHELRTPVQIVKGYAELLGGAEISEEYRNWAEVIGHQAARMERIVADLLMLAKLEHDPASWIVREKFFLKSVLAEAARTVRLQYADSGTIELDCPEELEAYANPGLIEQAAFNLMANAVQHSGSHEKILVGAVQEENDVVVRVRDFGAGISPKDLAHIFERFYRADKSRSSASGEGTSRIPSSGGSGLGLAIVKHIALAHGGAVRAESWAGEGSLFEFRFPNATEDSIAAARPEDPSSIPPSSS